MNPNHSVFFRGFYIRNYTADLQLTSDLIHILGDNNLTDKLAVTNHQQIVAKDKLIKNK
ncbi:hypothetical protein [Methanobacterium spitsbergense]|uniref:Uncharacterized protein n=1 Tax=Methanobacterium spitsbergense TaxID=2874285 RepID=A0A8T5V0Y5_9EURY|nr:hypothetical protein [Methanobacterium spitsbergense]MBZ2167110.1 hypothetical protein [Methanobacterium spitsbergense]